MIGPAGLVNDGLTAGCANNGRTTWTYNQGVVIGGLAVLYEITGDDAYLGQAETIAAAALRDLTVPPGILTEPGERETGRRDRDRPQFKGIFVRHLYELYRHRPRPATATSSWPTRPRCGATAGTGATRSGWPGPGRSTGPTRSGRGRRWTRSTPRSPSPILQRPGRPTDR